MKTLTFFVLSLCWLGANATIWRINNNPQVNAHFIGINEAVAHWTVNNGDTLYLENGTYFPASNVTKKLTLIGPGYFLLENDSTYANPLPTLIQTLTISYADCKIIGVKVIGSLTIQASNITVERSQMGSLDGGYFSGVTLRQSYVAGNINGNAFISSTIHNNIIIGNVSLSYGGSSHNFYNNVVYYNYGGTTYAVQAINATVINNIIIREPVLEDPNQNRTEYCVNFGSSGNANTSFAHNLMSQSPNVSFPANLYNQVKEVNFVLSGSTDEWWKLKTGSPAIGYGSNGDDCGAYGGPMYYVLSGLPWLLPRIIQAQIPSGGNGNVIPVHIVAKTQEE